MLYNYTKEFKYNLTLAYPVILGMLGHMFVSFADNIMVGQLGAAELAAVSLGIINNQVFLDLDYSEDSTCDADINIVTFFLILKFSMFINLI